MRRRLPCVLWLAGLLCMAGARGTTAEPAVIALHDVQVTAAELDRRFEIAVRLLAARQGVSLAGQDRSLIEQLRLQYLERYATELVLLREAGRRQLSIPGARVDAAVSEALADNEELESYIAATQGTALLREVVSDELTVELLTEDLLGEIRVPPGDVITLHHDIKDTLATPEQVCVRHIQTATAEHAASLLAELRAGAAFEELARAHSSDGASAASGGDLGCFERGARGARGGFEKAAFAAREGEVTGPVESRLGHHLLLVYERRMPRAPTLNEAYAQIERELALERLPQSIEALVADSGVQVHPENLAIPPDGG